MNVLMISLDRTIYDENKRGNFLNRLKKYAKHAKNITCLVYTPDEGYKTKKYGNIKIVPTNDWHPIWFPASCLNLAKKEKFDLIVTQDLEACGETGRKIKQKFKVPLVCNLFTLKPTNSFMEWITNRVLKNADLVRCESNTQKDWLKTKGYKGKVVVAPLGFDLRKFRPPKKRTAKNTVLYVGRLSPEKNVEMILKAAKLLPEVEFVIIGTGKTDYVASLEQKGGDNVHFKGLIPHDNLKKHYDNANMLVLTSKYEGLPTVLVEAMSNCLPIISTDFADVHELITNNDCGFIIKQDDYEQLVSCVQYLLSNPKIAEHRGNVGLARVWGNYGEENVIPRVVDGWKSVMK